MADPRAEKLVCVFQKLEPLGEENSSAETRAWPELEEFLAQEAGGRPSRQETAHGSTRQAACNIFPGLKPKADHSKGTRPKEPLNQDDDVSAVIAIA